MDEISRAFSDDHRRCDAIFIAVEQAVTDGEWAAVETAAARFVDAMEHHFSVEEGELFPALGASTAASAGPVQVMLMEHEQMRGLFAQLKSAVESKAARGCLDVTETLLMIMQQHNMKEENILYPMADRSLDTEGVKLAKSLSGD